MPTRIKVSARTAGARVLREGVRRQLGDDPAPATARAFSPNEARYAAPIAVGRAPPADRGLPPQTVLQPADGARAREGRPGRSA
jgi:hypothetical protein